MKTQLPFFAFLLFSQFFYSQIVINELDTDTPGQDFEEFIELKSDTPNFSLDGYVLVLFNGSNSGNDSSYFTRDLDGYNTDANGLLLIGSTNVSPVPELLISPALIQNGADAIAVYQGNDSDFPEGTQATTTNLIDALIYDTSDADDTGLMALLGISEQINENENGNQTEDSIQRNNDGTYTVTTPTPGALNDGSGIDFNGISFSTDQTEYSEGEIMSITFTTESPVTSNLSLNFTLTNGSFTSVDYSGNTSFIIPNGSSEATVAIQLLDDGVNDGDEFAEIDLGTIPEGYNRLVDNVEVLIVDVNFVVSAWGTPLNPTYNQVQSTQPNGYYESLTGLADDELRQAIQDIVANPDLVRAQTYADAIDILKKADQNPANSNEVWLVYTEQPRAKVLFQDTGGSNVGLWNREHTYPQSRGGFFEIEEDQYADGMDVFVTTNADSLRHGVSDAHGLRAVDGPENSSRNNRDYGEYNGPANTQGSWRGDVARAVMYMTMRYNGLALVNGNPPNNTVGELGDLEILLDWHRNDPPDDYELNRNNIVYTWQINRNPFIDRPELVEYIWGDQQGQAYDPSLEIDDNNKRSIVIYPNPTQGEVNISGIIEPTIVTIYTSMGKEIFSSDITEDQSVNLNLSSGVYLMVLKNEHTSSVKRLIIL